MLLTDFTTCNEVRAALGVSADEIEDATLALPIYLNSLLGEIRDVSVGLLAYYKTVMGTVPASRTEADQWLYESLRTFAVYAVAKQLSTSLPMFGPKDISDGKATVSRFADAPYKAVISAIQKDYDKFKARLESAWAASQSTTSSSTGFVFITSVSPSSDPVTGT